MWKERVKSFLSKNEYSADYDWAKAESLRQRVRLIRESSDLSHGLPPELFYEIADWKLRNQRLRTEHLRLSTPHKTTRDITALAFNVSHPDKRLETQIRFKLLTALPGVGAGLASAILSLYFPERYGIIDFRVWDEIHDVYPNQESLRRGFGLQEFEAYQAVIETFSAESGLMPYLIDYALWKIWKVRRLEA